MARVSATGMYQENQRVEGPLNNHVIRRTDISTRRNPLGSIRWDGFNPAKYGLVLFAHIMRDSHHLQGALGVPIHHHQMRGSDSTPPGSIELPAEIRPPVE